MCTDGCAMTIMSIGMLLAIVSSCLCDCEACSFVDVLLLDDELLACRCRKCVDRDGCVEE